MSDKDNNSDSNHDNYEDHDNDSDSDNENKDDNKKSPKSKYYDKYNVFLKKHNYKFQKEMEYLAFPILEYKKGNKQFIVKVMDEKETKRKDTFFNIAVNEMKINNYLLKESEKNPKLFNRILIPEEILYSDEIDAFFIIMPRMKKTLTQIPFSSFIKYCNEIVRDIVAAVDQLHKHKIVHCDIRPDNLFVTRKDNSDGKKGWGGNYIVKIGDFGLSNLLTEQHKEKTSIVFCGTFAPPERKIITNDADCFKMDIWQIGLTLYELFTRQQHENWVYRDYREITELIKRIPNMYFRNLLEYCMDERLDKRITLEQFELYLDNKKSCRATTSDGDKCNDRGQYFGYCAKHRSFFRKKLGKKYTKK
jgi:serine/threonine protein kinase